MDWKQVILQDAKTNAIVVPPSWVYLKYYEAFNLLFRIENALRVFVYTVLKEEYRDKWADICISSDEEGKSTIAALARKRQEQAKSFGYLGHPISCPVMHLTGGELTRLMVDDAYWKLFSQYFRGSKEIIRNKLEEIATVRNSLAHFRPIKDDDIATIKHNAKHVLLGIEDYLNQVLSQLELVPTNTDDKWYHHLKDLKSDHCLLAFYQSSDCNWIRIEISYQSPTLDHDAGESYQRWNLLTVDSSYLLTANQAITTLLTFLTEQVPYVPMPKEGSPKFAKSLSFVFSKEAMGDGAQLKVAFVSLLGQIDSETALILKDNRARGKSVYPVVVAASLQGDRQAGTASWRSYVDGMRTPAKVEDPPEFWGAQYYAWFGKSFIARAQSYPWMPEQVSGFDPF